jgi:hypothetical protein
MSLMLLQVRQKIIENADLGDVVAFDTLIDSPKLEWIFNRHTEQAALGTSAGAIVALAPE